LTDWELVWASTASAIAAHQRRGHGHLLTEDAVRWAILAALEKCGVPAAQVTFEHRVKDVGPIDLVVSNDNGIAAAVEIKFPRDPRERNSADTMTVGELLNDFYRLARVPAIERQALQVIGSRLAGYLSRRDPLWAAQDGKTMEMPADLPHHVRPTTREAMRAADGKTAVRAACTFACSVGDLAVIAYTVTPITTIGVSNAVTPQTADTKLEESTNLT
jgi:hypothetical protein